MFSNALVKPGVGNDSEDGLLSLEKSSDGSDEVEQSEEQSGELWFGWTIPLGKERSQRD